MTMKRVNKKVLQKRSPQQSDSRSRSSPFASSRTQGEVESYKAHDEPSPLTHNLQNCQLHGIIASEIESPENHVQEFEADNKSCQNSRRGLRSVVANSPNEHRSRSSDCVLPSLYQNDIAVCSNMNSVCCNCTNLNHADHRRKREKMGILKNLRRKFSSLSVRKATVEDPESYGHIGEQSSQNIDLNLADSHSHNRNKERHASDRLSQGASCDCCPNSPLKSYMSPKFSEWHSNTDHCDVELSKDKPGCFSKDISRFNPSMCKTGGYSKIENTSSCGSSTAVTSMPKNDEKHCRNEPVYELADCVEYDPVKEQTRIWSPKVWSLTQELFRLSKFGWYWGPITRNEAEDKLTNQPDGAFLVRDSSDERYLLSLSFRSFGRTLHTRIEHCNGMFSFYAQPDTEGYPSIVDLIERSMNDSQTGIFYYSRSRSPEADQIPVRLTKPVSRFTQVQSLQHMCRFVIRQYTRYDHIQQLPLPNSLKGWIEENQYWAVS